MNRYLDLSFTGRHRLGSYLFGLCIILFMWFFVGTLVSIAVWVVGNINYLLAGGLEEIVRQNPGNPLTLGDPLVFYVALNAGFWPFFAGCLIAANVALRRPWLTLITPTSTIDWRRIALGFAVWFVISGILTAIEAVLYPGRYAWTFDAPKFFPFMIAALLLTPFQTTAEELLFRGYLLQWTGHLTRRDVVLAAINGFCFMIPHLGNPEVATDLTLVASGYFVTGFALAWISLKSGSIEVAIGVHWANNLFAAVIATFPNSALQTSTLWAANVLDPVYGLVSLVVGYLVLTVALPKLTTTATPEP